MLAQRLNKRDYQDLCHSDRRLSTEEFANMGLIDVVADKGQGEQVVMEWIKNSMALYAHIKSCPVFENLPHSYPARIFIRDLNFG